MIFLTLCLCNNSKNVRADLFVNPIVYNLRNPQLFESVLWFSIRKCLVSDSVENGRRPSGLTTLWGTFLVSNLTLLGMNPISLFLSLYAKSINEAEHTL